MLSDLECLSKLVGREKALGEVAQSLHFMANRLHLSAVGALQVTCADEAEVECVNAFQRGFVQFTLPSLKFATQAPFRLANLGARYEWGAVPVAEGHFSAADTGGDGKLLVIKINAHVAVDGSDGDLSFGTVRRYDARDSCCGAIDALLAGAKLPFAKDLRAALESEGKDRLAILRDPHRVVPKYRPLLAAVASARLQARRAVVDIQNHVPKTPTIYVVMPCVTLNRPGRDGEIVVGSYGIDHRKEQAIVNYQGLGDDPGEYEVSIAKDVLTVVDPHIDVIRPARDHRQEVIELWRQRRSDPLPVNDQVRQLRERLDGPPDPAVCTPVVLKSLLLMMTELAPIPLAIMLFAHGAVGAHHLYRVHRLSRQQGDVGEAHEIISELDSRIDQMTPEEVHSLVQRLTADQHHNSQS